MIALVEGDIRYFKIDIAFLFATLFHELSSTYPNEVARMSVLNSPVK